jgi:carboxypeptidase Q
MLPAFPARSILAAATFAALAFLIIPAPTPAAEEIAPAPRPSAAAYDRALMDEVKSKSEIMKNLQYISDVIGARLTGSKNLERANNWTAERMKAYGLENVHLEPWEIPVGWERGKATMKIIEPENGRELLIASYAWTPGTKGKVTGDVVILKARTKADLQPYKGKLKNAVVLTSPPAVVKPISDLSLTAPPGPNFVPKKDEPKKEEPQKDEAKKPLFPTAIVATRTEDAQTDDLFSEASLQPGGELNEFLKSEEVACTLIDSGKPHGLLNMTGSWPTDRAAGEARLPRVFITHDHYALLYRLASREKEVTRVEVEIENKFIPGPITVYNTVGDVLGSEKPDEIVVVGGHLDSWDLGTGTTDNGTGSCVVLETARAVAKLASQGMRPKRTIRFILFTGEEEGLYGSKRYVEKHKDELAKFSVALVHDTGTGKVQGFGLHNRTSVRTVLEPELGTLATIDGWKGLEMRGMGGTDHLSFHAAGVPGFACLQDMDEYRLTHHSQSDTFDKAKEPNLIEGAQVMAITATRVANLPEMLPRK